MQLMVMDRCFLLDLMECHFDNYSAYNLIFRSHVRLIFFSTIWSDMVLLENQFSLLILQKLLAVEEWESAAAGMYFF